ncbi:MAG: Lon protease-like protein [Pseudomonadales bacterium]|jgi:Lon protease-like protein
MMGQIPIFPLGTILFPYGRIPLQIFEPRYVDLVKNSLKTNTDFGVVFITQGSEVAAPVTAAIPKMISTGCMARIVDWNALPNNKFEIVIEGQTLFNCDGFSMAKDNLISTMGSKVEREQNISVPEQYIEHGEVLLSLLDHPAWARLNFDVDINDAYKLSMQLAQVMPIDELNKLGLLECDSSMQRLAIIDDLLDELSG